MMNSYRQYAVDEVDPNAYLAWCVTEILTVFYNGKELRETEKQIKRFPTKQEASGYAHKLTEREEAQVALRERTKKKLEADEASGVQFTLPTGSRIVPEPEQDPNDPLLKAIKREVYKALKILKFSQDWYYGNQPWLHPQDTHVREDTEARAKGMRVGQNGKVRPLMMSDLGGVVDCQRSVAASYAGVAVKVRNDEKVYRGKGGTVFHEHVEGMLPDGFVTETSEKANQRLTGSKRDRTFTKLPSVGFLTTPAGNDAKKTAGIGGKIDAYLSTYNAGVEIKSVPLGDKLPEVLPQRAFGQAACYSHAFNSTVHEFKPKFWIWVYLPADLATFNPEDVSTYRVFIRSKDQLEEQFSIIWPQIEEIAGLVDSLGYEAALPKLHCSKDGTGEHCEFCHVNWRGNSTQTSIGAIMEGARR